MDKKEQLSDFFIKNKSFSNISSLFKNFKKREFIKKNLFEKKQIISKSLLQLIQKEEAPCFLLPKVFHFIEKIQEEKIVEGYDFSIFEMWLNHYSSLSFEENYFVRAKIAGKYLPREEYQMFFPIAMGKIYEGSHIVTAHKSPDLDSIVGSFWGWVDAFAARVGKSLHIWNVPRGLPKMLETDLFFRKIFGKGLWKALKENDSLSITGKDLLHAKNVIFKKEQDSTSFIDHRRHHNAVIVIDDRGFYLGEWRSFDVEDVKQTVALLDNAFWWFKNKLEMELISLFAKKNVTRKRLQEFCRNIFSRKIKDASSVKRYTQEQKNKLNDYLKKVLKVSKGMEASFKEVGDFLLQFSIENFSKISFLIKNIDKKLFDKKGILVKDRTKVLVFFEKLISKINASIEEIREYVDKLHVALKIKAEVFGYEDCYVTMDDEVEEIQNKIGPNPFLCVMLKEKNKNIPIGIVKASDLKKNYLGTVSLRDFSNFNEISISSYLDVISIIDHHGISLSTKTVPRASLSDAQASATIMSRMSMDVNNRYSLCGMDEKNIDEQIRENKDYKILKKLLQKKIILEKKEKYFIHPEREYLEYLHYIYAILDDTDLLMKVSDRDVEIIVFMLNKMKSIISKKQLQIIDLEDIPKDENFAKTAARKILQNKDMYSLYRKVYLLKEKEMEKNIKQCAKGKSDVIFLDTKVQNGCARISQMKMFSKNITIFSKYKDMLIKKWMEQSKYFFEEQTQIDLHMQMISTIRGAKEVFECSYETYKHKDELWIWVPFGDTAKVHLKKFLISFLRILKSKDPYFEVLIGKDAKNLREIFLDLGCKVSKEKQKHNLAVIRYKAGIINSRKSMISPYLPKLIS